ncbi:MAG: bifunctional hydroxymethylpyrimidine kinase/phosphomethylpyrimidine kinase [Phycisphaerales bacterium]|nr:bifunctional hydroxymethylpyrimidine kinase/phosphomethylpyrimidine kinase [Phycisphaerales bacterium]
MNNALTIAGSDSSGGAGIQADLKTFAVLGVFGASALTAITAQNTLGVTQAFHLDPQLIARQIDTVAEDIPIHACKTGMLSTAAIIEAVYEALIRHNIQPYVCDPVMVSKAGSRLLQPDAIETLKRILIPLAVVITPNRHETAVLTGLEVQSLVTILAAREAARRLVDQGARSAIVKAIPIADQRVDVYFDGRDFLEFPAPALDDAKTHGSGCTYSAAITAGLSNGLPLVDAIAQARQLVTAAIQHSAGQGRGTSPVNVLAYRAH